MNRRTFLLSIATATALGIVTPYHKKLHLFNSLKHRPLKSEVEILSSCANAIYPNAVEMGFATFLQKKINRTKEPRFRKQVTLIAMDLKKNILIYNTNATLKDKEIFIQQRVNHPTYATAYNLYISLVLESVFSSPIHGGNKNSAGWKNTKRLFNQDWLNG